MEGGRWASVGKQISLGLKIQRGEAGPVESLSSDFVMALCRGAWTAQEALGQGSPGMEARVSKAAVEQHCLGTRNQSLCPGE